MCVQLALRETFNRRAGITEQHAPGAVAVKQLFHEGGAYFCVLWCVYGQGCELVEQDTTVSVIEPGFQDLSCLLVNDRAFKQTFNGPCDGFVGGFFREKGVVVSEAIRVKQAQACEVAHLSELFRCGGQQQYTACIAGQLFHQLILGAGGFGRPAQVVCFIDNQQIPFTSHGLFGILRVVSQELQAAQHQLFAVEGVVGVIFFDNGLTALGIEHAEEQVEAPQHFHQPLVNQAFRHNNECTPRPFGQ